MKSAIEIRLKEFISENGLTNRTFAKNVGIGESTLYKKWREPDTFTDREIELIAAFIGSSFEHIKALCSMTENSDSIETQSQYFSSGISSLPQFLKISSFFIAAVFILYGAFSYFVFSERLPVEKLYGGRFVGSGEDVGVSEMSALPNFHSKLYRYDFLNVETTTKGEEILIEAKVKWQLIADPSMTRIDSFSAHGLHIGDSAAIIYKIRDNDDNEVWIGTAMLNIGRSGPANGYWMTIHRDTDHLKPGPFAIGTINLDRVSVEKGD